jgi:hypothetical protein
MMTRRVFTIFALATALTFPSSLVQLPMAWATASSSQKVEVEIMVRVFNKRNILQLPEGKVVRINFVFDEAMSSLAYGDTHQVAITGDDWTKESDKIWMFSQKTSMTFQTGEEGARYRAYCILDCIGMEHLNNLVIQVV